MRFIRLTIPLVLVFLFVSRMLSRPSARPRARPPEELTPEALQQRMRFLEQCENPDASGDSARGTLR